MRFHFCSCWKLMSRSMPSNSENWDIYCSPFCGNSFSRPLSNLLRSFYDRGTQSLPLSISAMAFVRVSSIVLWRVRLLVVFFNLVRGILCLSFSYALKLFKNIGKYPLEYEKRHSKMMKCWWKSVRIRRQSECVWTTEIFFKLSYSRCCQCVRITWSCSHCTDDTSVRRFNDNTSHTLSNILWFSTAFYNGFFCSICIVEFRSRIRENISKRNDWKWRWMQSKLIESSRDTISCKKNDAQTSNIYILARAIDERNSILTLEGDSLNLKRKVSTKELMFLLDIRMPRKTPGSRQFIDSDASNRKRICNCFCILPICSCSVMWSHYDSVQLWLSVGLS